MDFPETGLCVPRNALFSFVCPELPAVNNLPLARSRDRK